MINLTIKINHNLIRRNRILILNKIILNKIKIFSRSNNNNLKIINFQIILINKLKRILMMNNNRIYIKIIKIIINNNKIQIIIRKIL